MNNQEQSNPIERISIAADGAEANGSSSAVSLSDDGQLIPFESNATNLIADDNNNATDIFIYDRSNESVELISLATDGTDADSSSSNAVISGNGDYVTFNSSATNLVEDDNNDLRDIFLRDRSNKTTELVSIASDGSAANGLSLFSDINDTGDYIAFQSFASNLVDNDNNGVADIFLRDRIDGTTELISVSSEGVAANAASELGSISDDGRYVSFVSTADNLVEGDTKGASVFVYDRENATTTLASIGLEGAATNGDSSEGLLSDDGRYVVYQSDADNLVEGDTNNASDIFIYNLADETTELVSLTDGDELANGSSRDASISDDGRYVAFLSDADNLVEGDDNSRADIFIRDLKEETTIKVDADSFPLLSGDAQSLVFNSSLSDLVADDTNETGDVFSVNLEISDTKDDPDPIERLSTDSVRRFYNSQEGYHLYSLSDSDFISPLSATDPDSLSDESEKFNVLTSNLDALTGEELEDLDVVAVYQFFNSDTDTYLYTTDENEIDFVEETLDNYSSDGTAFYAFESDPAEIETIPVFRMLNTDTGAHFYTADQNELDFIQNNLSNFEMENQGEAVFHVLDL